MACEPCPGHGQDSEKPAGSPLPPSGGRGSEDGDREAPQDDWNAEAALDALVVAVDAGECEVPPEERDGAGQGLFVCLPAGEQALSGFARHGQADTMSPGPLLAWLHGANHNDTHCPRSSAVR